MNGAIPSDASTLRDCLHDVVCCLDDIRRLAETIYRVSANPLEGRPTAEEFHTLKNTSSTDDSHDGALWTGLLLESQGCLSEFWLAVQNASSALKALEPSTVVAMSDAFPSNWTVQCQAALDSSTAWLTWTRPRKGQDADVSRFLLLTAKPVPDLSPAMSRLEHRMGELFALRGQVKTDGTTTKKRPKRKGAPRQARTGKETAIVRAHKKGQRHDKTARIAGVFTRDGLPDVGLVQTVLNRESERERRSR